MKILMLVPFLPNTSTSGGQTRWYNIIKYLSKDHQITLFSLIKNDSERRFVPELERYCQKVKVFKRPKSPWTLRNLLLTAFSPYPLLVIRNWSPKERKAVKEELKKEEYDLIHAETFYVMPHIPKTEVPSIMVEQTIEYQVYKHYVDHEVFPLFRPIFMIDVLKLRFWEVFFWKKTDRLVAVSDEDRKKMRELIPGCRVDVIPNGVDADFYREKKVERKFPPRVMYGVTNFEWLQNVEAVDVLINEVWPDVRQQVPEAKLWIVGRMIPARIKDLANKRPDIEFTESIPDPRDAYRTASLMITPIRGSGGTRLKILEAMAASLPIISTSVGVAGLDLIDGKHVLIANTSFGLAKAAVNLLRNPKLAQKIGLKGREFVKTNFDWKVIVKIHNKIYKEVVSVKET
jgi:glycosyltransferase involved in cell wall biosynthesis